MNNSSFIPLDVICRGGSLVLWPCKIAVLITPREIFVVHFRDMSSYCDSETQISIDLHVEGWTFSRNDQQKKRRRPYSVSGCPQWGPFVCKQAFFPLSNNYLLKAKSPYIASVFRYLHQTITIMVTIFAIKRATLQVPSNIITKVSILRDQISW